MDAYLTKPIRLAQLRRAIEAWLTPPAKSAVAAASPSEPAAAPPAVDLNVLVALVGDEPAALGAVLRAFRVSVEQMSDVLRLAASSGSHHAVAAAAHKLKSGARALGAGRLAEVCANMEQASGDLSMKTLLPQLQGELQAVLAFLDQSEVAP
jgi:HPt (histidine-containing phosphotransfer) domain-containing protein